LLSLDSIETRKITEVAAETKGPFYIRFARENTPVMTTEETPFKVGKAEIFWSPEEGDPEVSIIACGPLVYNAILAALELEKEGIKAEVINNHTIKPMDEKAIIESAKKTSAVVTVEEHQIAGGMGSAVAELLAKNYPVPMEFVGVDNRFGESGEPNQLIEEFGMGVKNIKKAEMFTKKRIAKRLWKLKLGGFPMVHFSSFMIQYPMGRAFREIERVDPYAVGE